MNKPTDAKPVTKTESNVIPLAASVAMPDKPNTALANAATYEAMAKVQAAVMMAKQFPRDRIKSLELILNACQRAKLAEQGLYEYVRGGTKINSASIRLAEAIAQNWGNFEFGWDEISRGKTSDGHGFSEIVAFAWDVESNVRRTTKFQVKHWRDTKKGGYPLSDERDIYENNANQAARRLRACILNLIPGDIIDAAEEQCDATLTTNVNITPERVANMAKLFGELNITKEQLEKRIQGRVDNITPAQMLALTKIYNSIKDGISSPAEWFEHEQKADAEPPVAAKLDKLVANAKPKKEEMVMTPVPQPTDLLAGEKK